jgi:formylglycine-generating enzyme required for sulfatase activity
MKAAKLLITLCVFLTTLLGGGISLALEPPLLTVSTSGPTVSLSWTSVAGATGYTLYYAPYPEADTIGNIQMGNKTSMSASLPEGSAFYIALQAYNGVGNSGYSNIEHFIIGTPSTSTNSLGMTFILLPAGTFTMGSPADEPGRHADETQHQVTLTQPFYMQTTEVTQAQWEAVMGSNPSYFDDCPTCPVEMVSWNDVQEFVTKMNARGEGTYGLPTEAQWEYAARAGTNTAFHNGVITSYANMHDECSYDGSLTAIGWYCHNSDNRTHPVAQKSPNPWGLYDMSGNVKEWCQDWAVGGGIGDYDPGAATDPTGAASGWEKMVRGGDFYGNASKSRSANRHRNRPEHRASNARGVRLVLPEG